MNASRAASLLLVLTLLTATHASAAGRISIDARDTELADVVRLIGRQSGANVVADGSIKPQRITFRLRDVDVDTALTALAQAYNLQTHREGSILLVGDAAAMNRRYSETTDPGAPRTEIFPLAHARADELATALLGALPAGTVVLGDKRTASLVVTANAATLERARRLLTALDAPGFGPGANVASESVALRNARPSDAVKALHGIVPDAVLVADDRSNAVVVTGTREVVTSATALLEALDGPGRQVLLEVRVADVKPVDDSTNVGIQFGGTGFGAGALAQFPYTVTKSSIAVNAQVNALIQTGKAQILATPRIATLNNKEASILVGEQFPVVTVNQQTGFPSVQTIDVGVRLRITPTIGADGAITADAHTEYSQIIGFNASFPVIANRKIDATLRVGDGETIVLGGLFQDVSSETISKLPFLGDVPILGPFFRNKARTHTRDEVVFFITPRLI
jgi:type II secretory pathway component GspD/PulD (secretin)